MLVRIRGVRGWHIRGRNLCKRIQEVRIVVWIRVQIRIRVRIDVVRGGRIVVLHYVSISEGMVRV